MKETEEPRAEVNNLPFNILVTLDGCPPCDYAKTVLAEYGKRVGGWFLPIPIDDLPQYMEREDLRTLLHRLRPDGGGALHVPAWIRMEGRHMLACGQVEVSLRLLKPDGTQLDLQPTPAAPATGDSGDAP